MKVVEALAEVFA